MIELQNINKYYKESHVLKNVNLNVRKGEIYGLIGKNGAGKTTIFKIILGLTQFDKGKLIISESKNRRDLIKNRKKIGFLSDIIFLDI